jgi:hypothetical protein
MAIKDIHEEALEYHHWVENPARSQLCRPSRWILGVT